MRNYNSYYDDDQAGCFAVLVLGGIAVILILLFHFWHISTEEFNGTVIRNEWVYTRNIERYKTVNEGGFLEQLPKMAFDIRKEGTRFHNRTCSKVGKINTCTDHWHDWYVYKINRWVLDAQFVSEGIGQLLEAPKISMDDRQYETEACGYLNNIADLKTQSEDRSIGCWREVASSFVYKITFSHTMDFNRPVSENIMTCNVTQQQYRALNVNDAIKGKFVSHQNKFLCETLVLK